MVAHGNEAVTLRPQPDQLPTPSPLNRGASSRKLYRYSYSSKSRNITKTMDLRPRETSSSPLRTSSHCVIISTLRNRKRGRSEAGPMTQHSREPLRSGNPRPTTETHHSAQHAPTRGAWDSTEKQSPSSSLPLATAVDTCPGLGAARQRRQPWLFGRRWAGLCWSRFAGRRGAESLPVVAVPPTAGQLAYLPWPRDLEQARFYLLVGSKV
jgi:hypothetical protein